MFKCNDEDLNQYAAVPVKDIAVLMSDPTIHVGTKADFVRDETEFVYIRPDVAPLPWPPRSLLGADAQIAKDRFDPDFPTVGAIKKMVEEDNRKRVGAIVTTPKAYIFSFRNESGNIEDADPNAFIRAFVISIKFQWTR